MTLANLPPNSHFTRPNGRCVILSDTLITQESNIMETVNEALETVIDAALLDAYVNKAQSAYKLYKSAAMESAANCYLVWYYAASEQADQFANAWFDKKVAAYNAKVDDFNNGLPTLEARMKAYVSGELTDIDATEMAKLKEYISYSHDDWGKASKLKAEAREGARPTQPLRLLDLIRL